MQPINDTFQTPVPESKRNRRTRRKRRPEMRVRRRALYCAPWFTTLLLSGNTQAQVPPSASQTQDGQDKQGERKGEASESETEAAYQHEREEAWRRSRRMTDKREEMKLRAETERALRDYEDAKRQRIEAQERSVVKSDGMQKRSARRLTDAGFLFPDLAFGGASMGGRFYGGAGPITFGTGRSEESIEDPGGGGFRTSRSTTDSLGLSLSVDRITRSGLTWGGAVRFSLDSWSHEVRQTGNSTYQSVSAESGGQFGLSPRIGFLAPLGDEIYLWPRASVNVGVGRAWVTTSEGERPETSAHLGATVDCGLIFALSKHLFLSITPTVSFEISGSSSTGSAANGQGETQSVGFGTRAGFGLAL